MDQTGVFSGEIEQMVSTIRASLELPAGMDADLMSKVRPVVDAILGEVDALLGSCPSERRIVAAERDLNLARQVLTEAPRAARTRCAAIAQECEWRLHGLQGRRAETSRRLKYIQANLMERKTINSEMCTWWTSFYYVQMRATGMWVYGTWGHGERGDGGTWHQDLVLLPRKDARCAA